jgi:cell division protein FtsB
MNFFSDSISEKKFSLLILIITLYILYNFFGGDRGLIEYFKKKILLKEFEQKNLEIKKEINLFAKKNDFLSANINRDYLDEVYRDYFVMGKKGEKIYIINKK